MGEQSLGFAHYFACVYRPHHLTLMIVPQISLLYSTVDGFYHASTLPIVKIFITV